MPFFDLITTKLGGFNAVVKDIEKSQPEINIGLVGQ